MGVMDAELLDRTLGFEIILEIRVSVFSPLVCVQRFDDFSHLNINPGFELLVRIEGLVLGCQEIRGQRDGLRSRSVIDRVHDWARVTTEKYRAACSVKLHLSGSGDWEKELKPLADTDIRG